jgi:Hemerythrin HHE cation binding domain
MGFTDKFRVQHNDILKLAGELMAELGSGVDAAVLRKLLSNIAGKINMHLAMEDKALYPRLLEQKDTQVNAVATRFMKEMGGLGGVFAAYNSKWQVSDIRANPGRFTDETRQVFAALTNRIARENGELYPLADRDA